MPTKTIKLSNEDMASVQRLLTSLTDVETVAPDDVTRLRLVNMARASLAVRKRRSEFLHRAMLGEPAYDMLLGLYVADADDQVVTAARLAEGAGVAQSSALRWIEYLVAKELILRHPHPSHKRASALTLSPKGRQALEGVFRAILDGIHDAAI